MSLERMIEVTVLSIGRLPNNALDDESSSSSDTNAEGDIAVEFLENATFRDPAARPTTAVASYNSGFFSTPSPLSEHRNGNRGQCLSNAAAMSDLRSGV